MSLARARLPVVLCALLLGCARDSPDPAWVTFFDPGAASPGYTLILHQRRVPMLIDLNGNEVHRWNVRASGRARLLPDGRLLIIADNGAFEEYDWNGERLLAHRLEGEDFLHHDLIELQNRNRLLLAHDMTERLDYLLELDSEGATVRRWDAIDYLRDDLEPRHSELKRAGSRHNLTHTNSVRELPPNHWFDAGDTRFRPGNLLLSVRNLNLLVILDRGSGEVVWRFEHGLDRQHEATMIPAGYPGAGNITVFNNGLENRFVHRRSEVLEIDPGAGVVVWSYRAPNFFSSTGGIQQALLNGNVLIGSSRGGRVFEVTRAGRIVWQWVPSYGPVREARYPYDHCPQLARLRRPRPRRVQSDVRTHVDYDLHAFKLRHETRMTRIAGKEVRRLAGADECSELLLPEDARMTAGWALEPGAADASTAATIAATIRLHPAGDAPARVVFERELRLDTASTAAGGIERETIDLAEHGLQIVELCLAATRSDGGPTEGAFFWTPPFIRGRRVGDAESEAADDPATRELREKHLRALGYVD